MTSVFQRKKVEFISKCALSPTFFVFSGEILLDECPNSHLYFIVRMWEVILGFSLKLCNWTTRNRQLFHHFLAPTEFGKKVKTF